MKKSTLALLCTSLAARLTLSAWAQGSSLNSFTYQGRLNEGANPTSGSYDLRFSVYDNSAGGSPQGPGLTNSATAVESGLFTVTLDFGNQFSGANRWLEIAVRTNGGGAFTPLTPLQAVTPAPYAIFANTASNVSGRLPVSQLSGTLAPSQLPASLVTNNAAGLTLAGTFSGNGAGLTGVNAATLGGLSSANFWKINGNAGATPTNGAFLGTTDNLPLELRVGGLRVLRLEPDPRPVALAGNFIGGFTNNLIEQPGSGGDFIGGGG